MENMNKNNDKIGIVGATMQDDYGLIMSHLGLCEILQKYHNRISIIPPPFTKNYCRTSIPLFQKRYQTSQKLSLKVLSKYNDNFSTFLLGPGEVWDWNFYSNGCADSFSYLNFVSGDKHIVTYGTTFKLDYPSVLIAHPDKHLEYKERLKRFNCIGVASEEDLNILRSFYGITNAECVIDASFLPTREFFLNFIDHQPSRIKNSLTIYPINNISQNKMADKCAATLNCGVQKIATGNPYECQRLKDCSIVLDNVFILNPPEKHMSFQNWLRYIAYSKYVMCCDYASVVASIIFKKNFIVFENADDTRIKTLTDKLGLQNRVVKNHETEKALRLFQEVIDWKDVYKKLDQFRNKSIAFLIKSLRAN